MSKKILIIVPHADDEIISFGGYIIDELSKGSEIHIRIAAIGGEHRLQNEMVRFGEFTSVMNELGLPKDNYSFYSRGTDAKLSELGRCKLTTLIDNTIDTIKPDEVLTCYPSTHQDHKFLYECFMASMRLRDGFMPKKVLFGEYPFILTSIGLPFNGKYYHPLSEETLNKKIDLFYKYESQVRPSPSPLGERGIRILATTRGLECGSDYAELFYVYRIIE